MASSSDATLKILGFEYQKMVALLNCLDSPSSPSIYLECHGDISDGTDVSIEVKHSNNSKKLLSDTHIDFWKTLSNIIDEYDSKFQYYGKFILFTTAKIKPKSLFENWDSKNEQTKKNEVCNVSPTNTISKYYTKVKKTKAHILKDILKKFEFKTEQLSAKDFYVQKILKHPLIYMPIDNKKDADNFACLLLGYLTRQLILSSDNHYCWEINMRDFRSTYQAHLANLNLQKELMFIESNESTKGIDPSKFRFVNELKKIDYSYLVGTAMRDYIRAADSQLRMIKSRDSLISGLESYDRNLKGNMDSIKEKFDYLAKTTNDEDLLNLSKQHYDECIDKIQGIVQIAGISAVHSYYPKGRVHHNVEVHRNFKWKLKK